MPDGRVLLAGDDPALEPNPTWTRLDDVDGLVAGIEINRGRQTEFDQTDTSTAVIHLNDTTGDFDPDNLSSPYFEELDGRQIMLQLWNPITEAWVPQWRGVIDDYGWDLHPSQLLSNIQIQCVDAFAYLAEVEMIPGLFGQGVSSNGSIEYDGDTVQVRITNLLTDAYGGDVTGVAWLADMARIFTGNVDVLPTKYDPGDSILVAIRDAADAEMPGIANVYTDKLGRVCFHGRRARFDPETTMVGSDWDFTRWTAGDSAAIGTDPTKAQVRPPLTWSRPRSRIINAAIAYPRLEGGTALTAAQMAAQVVLDDTGSRDRFGYRSWSAPDLIVDTGTTTGNTALAECRLFAQYYIDNYAYPHSRVEQLTFKAISPNHPQATETWALLAGADISDVISLAVTYPGLAAPANRDFYIEGSNMSITPLNPEHDMVELSLNVSPAAYYANLGDLLG